jgi:hypothetical protein
MGANVIASPSYSFVVAFFDANSLSSDMVSKVDLVFVFVTNLPADNALTLIGTHFPELTLLSTFNHDTTLLKSSPILFEILPVGSLNAVIYESFAK